MISIKVRELVPFGGEEGNLNGGNEQGGPGGFGGAANILFHDRGGAHMVYSYLLNYI